MTTTSYVATEVPMWGGFAFYIDGNSKITASNGTFENPKPNAFSLPHQATCPGATPSCLASCYVHGLKKNAPEVYAKYEQNERVLHRVLMTTKTATRAAAALGEWITQNAPGGFRWHVSGDVMHERHTDWIYMVCRNSPTVDHWIYTKSLELVPILNAAENLVVNVSADRDNLSAALPVARKNGVRICYMSQDIDDVPDCMVAEDVIFPDYPARGRELDEPMGHPWWQARTEVERRLVCPADFFGQSESHRCGPCRKCMKAA